MEKHQKLIDKFKVLTTENPEEFIVLLSKEENLMWKNYLVELINYGDNRELLLDLTSAFYYWKEMGNYEMQSRIRNKIVTILSNNQSSQYKITITEELQRIIDDVIPKN